MDTTESMQSVTEAEELTVPDAGEGLDTPGPAGGEMSPAEALERLRRGEAIEGTRIVGLKLKGDFEAPVRFRNVTLAGLHVEKGCFAREVAFEHCTLDRPVFNRKSTFEEGLCLSASTLIKANLRGLTVRGNFRCDNIRTRGRFLIEGARFEGKVRFWEAQFQGWAEFKGCEFAGEADFRSFHAEQGVILDRCRFLGDALFRGSTVCKKWQADGSRFEGLLDLSKAKLHDFVYLEAIEQGERQSFAFGNTLGERILVRPEQVAGRLASENVGQHAQAMQEFGFLKLAFEALHRYEHEDWAYYRFKVNQRKCKARSWRKPWTKLAECGDWLLLDHGCGYGTNPARAVRAALLIILAFALVYALGVESLYVEHLPFDGQAQGDLANRVMIGALTSVTTFTSGFGDIRGAARGWMNLPLIAESILGTLLWGLFIVAFSRKVIR